MTTPTIRIFVSSTFNDFIAEREILHAEVFPMLREKCDAAGVQFQTVDLRWGVSEQASRDHRTIDICLEEVRRCQRVSPRPNFIALLGERFGWQPVPYQIDVETFDKVRSYLGSAGDRDFLEECYPAGSVDYNAIPAQRQLKIAFAPEGPRSEARLRAILKGASHLFGPDPLAAGWFDLSATGLEVMVGILDPDSAAGSAEHVCVLERIIAGLPETVEAGRYRDMDGPHPDTTAGHDLTALKDRLRSLLGAWHYLTYHERWTGSGSQASPVAQITHTGFTGLSAKILRVVGEQVDAKIAMVESRDAVSIEDAAHAAFGAELARDHVGRAEDHAVLRRFLAPQPAPTRPLVIVGAQGSGKSAFMASVIAGLSPAPGAAIVARYVGASPDSYSAPRLLEDLWRLLGHPGKCPVDPSRFRSALEAWLADHPAWIFIDGVDQLSERDARRLLDALPAMVASGSRIVLSCSDDRTGALAFCEPAYDIRTLSQLDVKDARAMIVAWLLEDLHRPRRLTPAQLQAILDGFVAAGSSALYLRIAVLLARRWSSFDDATPLAVTVTGLLQDFVGSLVTRWGHGEVLVGQVMSLIAASRAGLGEEELLEILSANAVVMEEFRTRHPNSPAVDRLPDIVWARLFHDIAPFLGESSAQGYRVLRMRHRQLASAQTSALRTPADMASAHRQLADHFGAKASRPADKATAYSLKNQRGLYEYPWQLLQCGAHAELAKWLVTPRNIVAMSNPYFIDDKRGLVIGGLDADAASCWTVLRTHGFRPRELYLEALESEKPEAARLAASIDAASLPDGVADIGAVYLSSLVVRIDRVLAACGEERIEWPDLPGGSSNDAVFSMLETVEEVYLKSLHLYQLAKSIKSSIEAGQGDRRELEALRACAKEVNSQRPFIDRFIADIEPGALEMDQELDHPQVNVLNWEPLAQCYFIIGQVERAAGVYQDVIERLTRNDEFAARVPKSRMLYGRLLEADGQLVPAMDQFWQALESLDRAMPAGDAQTLHALKDLFAMATYLPDAQSRVDAMTRLAGHRLKHATTPEERLASLQLCHWIAQEQDVHLDDAATRQVQELLTKSFSPLFARYAEDAEPDEAQAFVQSFLPVYEKLFGHDHSKTATLRKFCAL